LASGADNNEGPVSGPFTTHQVATMLGVSLPTVVNWCKQGRLQFHRTPGGHRRIAVDDLARFVATHNYPVPAILERKSKQPSDGGVLIVSAETDFAELVSDYLELKRRYTVRVAEHSFIAGVLLGRLGPEVLIWDEDTQGLDLTGLDEVTRMYKFPRPPVILTTDFLTIEHRAALDSGRLFAVLQKPVSLDGLLESLDRAMNKI